MTIMSKLAPLFAASLFLASSAGESPPPQDQMISVGSHRLHTHLKGKGVPPVVIDAGLGDDLETLRPLQNRIAQVTQVITYSRAGYGRSEPGPLPRHADRETEELKALLDKTSVSGPFVLVGHSFGALNMQVFASKYPDEVAGMVLVDPSPLPVLLGQEYEELKWAETTIEEWQAIVDSTAGSTDAKEQARSAFFRMKTSELRVRADTARQVRAISTFGDLPLVVLASGKPNPTAFGKVAEEFQRFWIEQSRTLIKKSSNGKFILAEEASHYIHKDEPELVAQSILSVVYQARAK